MEEQNRMIEAYKQAGRKAELKKAIRTFLSGMGKVEPPPDCRPFHGLSQRASCTDMDESRLETLRFESVHNYIGDDNIIRKRGDSCL